MKKKEIPIHNYIIVAIIFVVSILITLYITNLIKSIRESEFEESVFSENINEVFLNELPEALSETNQIILYISYTNDSKVNSMEKSMLKRIKEKGLNDYLMYVNVTEFLEKDEYLKILKKEFSNISEQITNAPLFIYVKNGKAVEAFSSELKMIDEGMLDKIVSKYEIGA